MLVRFQIAHHPPKPCGSETWIVRHLLWGGTDVQNAKGQSEKRPELVEDLGWNIRNPILMLSSCQGKEQCLYMSLDAPFQHVNLDILDILHFACICPCSRFLVLVCLGLISFLLVFFCRAFGVSG